MGQGNAPCWSAIGFFVVFLNLAMTSKSVAGSKLGEWAIRVIALKSLLMHACKRQGLIERAQNSVVRSHGTKSLIKEDFVVVCCFRQWFSMVPQMRSCENSSSGHKINFPHRSSRSCTL